MNGKNYFPQLKCTTSLSEDGIIAVTDDEEFSFTELPSAPEDTLKFLALLDGKTAMADIIKKKPSAISSEDAVQLIESMVLHGLVLKNTQADFLSGKRAILEIEDVQNKLLHQLLYKNIFWEKCKEPGKVPVNVYIGMAIENYHLLSRGSSFDAHALYFHGSRKARETMNNVFCGENGHCDIILSGLKLLGLEEQSIIRSVPLPETLGLANALAFWSANDSLFFFSTLEVLEGKDSQVDGYVTAMENSGKISTSFVEIIKSHSLINIKDKHASLGRQLFSNIPAIAVADVNRMKRQTHLFIEICDTFYRSVWDYYSQTDNLLRVA
ncbi:hypothetical protein ACL2XP_26970 [Sodalis sp. RH21]|uniref:hypothetical protein n=1 Tax=unclassified Sodalis (in: enterobacteria) TaxID=2636512 RepID=UPI0039B6DA3E